MNAKKLVIRYFLLLLCSSIAGGIGGILYPSSMGVRGAILGFFLGLGIILTNAVEMKRLLQDEPPRVFVVIASAVLAGLLAGVLLNIYGMGGGAKEFDFPPSPAPQGMATIVMGIIYGLLFHFTYHLRWGIKAGQWIACIALLLLAGCVAAMAKTFFLPVPRGGIVDYLFGMALFSAFTGIPLGLFWSLSMISFDPAWSFTRIEQLRSKTPEKTDGGVKALPTE